MRYHIRRLFPVIARAVLAVTVLAACGPVTDTRNTTLKGQHCMKVGILLPENASSGRWETKDHPLLVTALQQALPGVQIHTDNAEGNQDLQYAEAKDDLNAGYCILIVAPFDSVKATTIVQLALSYGVPVISYDRLIQDNNVAYYVSFDNAQVGTLQGQYIVDHAASYRNGKSGNLAMLNGAQTDNNALLFKQGAHSKLDPLISNATLRLVYETFTPNWDNAVGLTEFTAAWQQSGGNIQIAYAANDGLASSVISLLKQYHREGTVLVTGQDATTVGIRNILLGYQTMTIYKPIIKEVNATAQLVAAISQGTSTAQLASQSVVTQAKGNIPSVLLTATVVDKSNVATTVIQDGYVSKYDVCQGIPANVSPICQ